MLLSTAAGSEGRIDDGLTGCARAAAGTPRGTNTFRPTLRNLDSRTAVRSCPSAFIRSWAGILMRSLRSRLSALWIMLAISGAGTAYILLESFHQSSDVRVARAEELVARGCRVFADRYQFFVSGWSGAPGDERLKQELLTLVQSALVNEPGVEGGVWQADAGSLAYAILFFF